MNSDYLFKVKIENGKRIYENLCRYVHCRHNGKLIKAVTNWGNVSWICSSCGEVVKKDLTPTAT